MITVPTRYLNGVSTAPKDHPLGNYKHPNPFAVAAYENDFFTYASGDWTITTSTGSTALTAGNGGRILQTTSAGANDIQANVKNPAAINFAPGFQTWFMWRGQVDTLNAVMQIGIQTGGTAFAPTDGVFFTKANATVAVNLNIRKAGVSTIILMANLTVAAATDVVLAFYYDGRALPTLFAWGGPASSTVNPTPGDQFNTFSGFWSSFVTASSVPNATNTLTNLPLAATLLSPIIGVQAGTAVVRTMNTDYLLAANEIAR